MKKKILIIFLFLTIFMLMGCNIIRDKKISEFNKKPDEKVDIHQNIELETQEIHNKIDSKKIYIDEIISNMSLREKIGQVFICAFRYNQKGLPITTVKEELKKAIEEYHLGGIIFFSENIDTVEQTQELIQNLQSLSNIPLFIAIDEEGGIVSRLNHNTNIGATKLPGNQILGETKNPQLAYRVGRLLGCELSSLGFNMNLAPVADINTNPKNPVIGQRSFGKEPFMVGKMVAQMVAGLQDEKVSAVAKHFPGHGDTALDTHKEAVVLPHNIERLKTVEFIPFIRAIEEGVDGIMLAHLQVPHITYDNLPATFSEEIIVNILRKELQHDKLIVTDALEMGAISKYWSCDEAAVLAFKAGVDILLMPKSLEKAYQGLLKAVEDGDISIERLDESVRRILTVKYERGILNREISAYDPIKVLGSSEHQKIVEEIFQERKLNKSIID